MTDKMGKLSGFADDHGLRQPFKASDRQQERLIVNGLEKSMIAIKNWMDANKLQMNSAKTELIMFGNKVQLNKCVTSHITVDDALVERSSVIKYLGVVLDDNLSLRKHIVAKCKTASFNLHNIRSIRTSLTVEACKQVVHGLVLSHLDYCNALYMGLPKLDIQRMQRIQNASAKLILNLHKMDSSTEALKTLHWLPIYYRIIFKVLTLVHKCLHGLAPSYLMNLLSLSSTSSYSLRSSKRTNILHVPRTYAKSFADRSFSVFAPKHWNTLPDNIRQITSLTQFRKELKTYLFHQAFDS